MFDSIKEAMKMKGIHDQLKKEQVTVEKQGVSVTINGAFSVESVILPDGMPAHTQANLVRECFNEALRKLQTILAQKFSGLMR
jgi:DNA-binding protein YbaB